MSDEVACGHCRGVGRVAMSDQYAAALRMVRLRPGSNTTELAVCFGVSQTLMVNRMSWLMVRGFVHRTGPGAQGRPFCWHPGGSPDV